jgi:hypothetical protein
MASYFLHIYIQIFLSLFTFDHGVEWKQMEFPYVLTIPFRNETLLYFKTTITHRFDLEARLEPKANPKT